MERDTFQAAARKLARTHGHLTAKLLASELALPAADAKRQLQAMYDGGALELDLDGDDVVYRLKGEARPAPAPRAAAQPAAKAAPRGPRIAEPAHDPAEKAAPPDSASAPQDADEDDGESLADNLKEVTEAMVTRGKTAIATAAVGALMDEEGAAEVTDEDKKSMLWGVGLGAFLPGLGLFYSAPMLPATIASVLVLGTLGILQLIPVLGAVLSYFLFAFFMFTSGALGAAYTYYFNKTGRRTRLTKGGKGLRRLPF